MRVVAEPMYQVRPSQAVQCFRFQGLLLVGSRGVQALTHCKVSRFLPISCTVTNTLIPFSVT